jgi:cytidylate kinase
MDGKIVITIDGPAGSGKSTISRLLADHYAYTYLDTGALYRAMAFRLWDAGFREVGPEALELCRRMKLTLKRDNGSLRVWVEGEDLSDKIRTEEIGLYASRISAIPIVRQILLSVQREIGAGGGVVAEGRDMGTVVFPSAEVKFFLDASVEKRAERRYLELIGKGIPARQKDVEEDLIIRDRQDRERSVSPLLVPAKAVVIDTSEKTIPQVIDIMRGVIDKTLSLKGTA